jgi:hypothetical protein
MTAVPTSGAEKNFEIGNIETNTAGSTQSTLHLDMRLTGPANRYENGSISITGVGAFSIVSNTNVIPFWNDDVVVTGLPGSAAVGQPFTIYDDDDKYLSNLTIAAPLPKNGDHATIVNGIQTTFAAAYIEVEDATALGWNTGETVPFILNAPGAGLFGANVWDGAKNLNSTATFWSWLVVFGYQPSASEDRDPDDEGAILGLTPLWITGSRFGYSVVYVESIREAEIGGSISAPILSNPVTAAVYRASYKNRLLGTVAHEMAHGPSNQSESEDHGEGGLLREGGGQITGVDSAFAPPTILRFRGRTSW